MWVKFIFEKKKIKFLFLTWYEFKILLNLLKNVPRSFQLLLKVDNWDNLKISFRPENRKKGLFLSHLFPKNEVFHSRLPTSPDSGNETYFVVLFESNSIRKDYLPVNLHPLFLF